MTVEEAQVSGSPEANQDFEDPRNKTPRNETAAALNRVSRLWAMMTKLGLGTVHEQDVVLG